MNSLVEICMVHLALADEKSFGHRKLLFLSTSIIISIFFCIVACGLISYQGEATSGPSVIKNATATCHRLPPVTAFCIKSCLKTVKLTPDPGYCQYRN